MKIYTLAIVLFFAGCSAPMAVAPIDFSFQGVSIGDPMTDELAAKFNQGLNYGDRYVSRIELPGTYGGDVRFSITVIDSKVEEINVDGSDYAYFELRRVLIEKHGEPHFRSKSFPRYAEWETTNGTLQLTNHGIDLRSVMLKKKREAKYAKDQQDAIDNF